MKTIIHAQPSLLHRCLADELIWDYSSKLGTKEIDIIVDNEENLFDRELCSYYGLDYDQVNYIEFI